MIGISLERVKRRPFSPLYWCIQQRKKQTNTLVVTAQSTKEGPCTSAQVILEASFICFSYSVDFQLVIYQIVSRNAYKMDCQERKG